MNLVTAEHLTKSYMERLLFDDTDFSINEGDKIGLIGINGTGKSTLLKLVAGLEEPDSGRIVRGRNLDIRYLPQNPVFHPGETVLESVLRENEGHEHVWDIESQAKSMFKPPRNPGFQREGGAFIRRTEETRGVSICTFIDGGASDLRRADKPSGQ